MKRLTQPTAYQELRRALLWELGEACAEVARARLRRDAIIDQLAEAQQDQAEDQRLAARERLYAHWERRTGRR